MSLHFVVNSLLLLLVLLMVNELLLLLLLILNELLLLLLLILNELLLLLLLTNEPLKNTQFGVIWKSGRYGL